MTLVRVGDVDGLLRRWLQEIAPAARPASSLIAAVDCRTLQTVAAKVAGSDLRGLTLGDEGGTDAERAQAAVEHMRECGASTGLAAADVLNPAANPAAVVSALCALFHRWAVFNPALHEEPAKRALAPASHHDRDRAAGGVARARLAEVPAVVRRWERLRHAARDGERWQEIGWAVGAYGRALAADSAAAALVGAGPTDADDGDDPCSLPDELTDNLSAAQVGRIEGLLREHQPVLRKIWLHYRLAGATQQFTERDWLDFCDDAKLGAKAPALQKPLKLFYRDAVARAGAAERVVTESAPGDLDFAPWLQCVVQASLNVKGAGAGDDAARVASVVAGQLVPLAPRADIDALHRAATERDVIAVLSLHRDQREKIMAHYRDRDDHVPLAAAAKMLGDLAVPEERDMTHAALCRALSLPPSGAPAGAKVLGAGPATGLDARQLDVLIVAAAMAKKPNPLQPTAARLAAFFRDPLFAKLRLR